MEGIRIKSYPFFGDINFKIAGLIYINMIHAEAWRPNVLEKKSISIPKPKPIPIPDKTPKLKGNNNKNNG